jgi:hypothetical protein
MSVDYTRPDFQRPHHVLATPEGDIFRHLCLDCGEETVGNLPALPCPGGAS